MKKRYTLIVDFSEKHHQMYTLIDDFLETMPQFFLDYFQNSGLFGAPQNFGSSLAAKYLASDESDPFYFWKVENHLKLSKDIDCVRSHKQKNAIFLIIAISIIKHANTNNFKWFY